MDILNHVFLWTLSIILPISYVALAIRHSRSSRRIVFGFNDHLTIFTVMVLFPSAWIATEFVGNHTINGIVWLKALVNIISLTDLWVAISCFVAAWKFERAGLVVSGILLFSLAVGDTNQYIQNNLFVLLISLLSFSIGFSEKLKNVGGGLMR